MLYTIKICLMSIPNRGKDNRLRSYHSRQRVHLSRLGYSRLDNGYLGIVSHTQQ